MTFSSAGHLKREGKKRFKLFFFIGDEASLSSENLMKVYPNNMQRVQKNEFSVTESAEPAGLWKIYLASCHQFLECSVNPCFWNREKINS